LTDARRFLVNATDQSSRSAGAKPTVVLVHGAFADGSSWNGVIERLGEVASESKDSILGTAQVQYRYPVGAGG
jgi:hypothetical protein